MRRSILVLPGLIGMALMPLPALAETIAPKDAAAHSGKLVTVEGVASVYTPATGTVTFVDLDGSGPSAPFSAIIMAGDAAKFPDVKSLSGKKVDVTGTIQMFKGSPEIVLTKPDQLKQAQ